MQDTGERMIPAYHKGNVIYGEHMSRYLAVASAVRGRVVLDIACGTGYGTQIIAKDAAKVFGVDISKETIEYAKENFNAQNITYKLGNASKIPLEDNSVDAVVSFETIEHIKEYEKFVDEVKRVLKDDGQFIVSTPNDDEFIDDNEFHVHEFQFTELKELVKKNFKNSKFYYQGVWYNTALLSETDFKKEWRKNIDTYKAVEQPSKKAIYFVAVCSNIDPVDLSELSVISQPWNLKSERLERQEEMGELEKKHHNLEQDFIGLSKSFETLTQNAKDYIEELNSIKQSKAWRYISRYNNVRSKFSRKKSK